MILLLFFLAGLIIGAFRSGGLSGLARMGLKAPWLVLVSALAVLPFYLLPSRLPGLFPALTAPLQILRFAALILFVLLNIRNWRIILIGVGVTLNFAVIAANGWQMPISWTALQMPELAASVQKVAAGHVPDYRLMPAEGAANLWYLADILPFRLGDMGFASVGDAILGVGVLLAVQHGMARYSHGKHARGSLARRLPADEPRRNPSPITELADMPAVPAVQVNLPAQTNPSAVAKTPPAPAPRESDLHLLKNAPASEFRPEPAQAAAGGEISMRETVKLSPRLETIAGMIGRGVAVADVGCDHGKLAARLALDGAPSVIAMDISTKSLAKARQLARDLDLQDIVQTRVSDGLKKLRRGEAGAIVLAGMGGSTMCAILGDGRAVAAAASRIILQPMNNVGTVRRWLTDNGYKIIDEQLAQEDERIYQILAASPGQDNYPPMSLFDLEVGHHLIDSRHPLLPRLMEYKIRTIDTILEEIAGFDTPKAEARREELLRLKQRCEEVSRWLAQ